MATPALVIDVAHVRRRGLADHLRTELLENAPPGISPTVRRTFDDVVDLRELFGEK